jgi:hypothetical protein
MNARTDKMTTTGNQPPKPWYREPWPWILMAGPLAVVVASLASAWIAMKSSDGLVTEDYYKQGQDVVETLDRSKQAEALGLQALVRLTENKVRVRLSGRHASMPIPSALFLSLSHPTRAGLDQRAKLSQDGQVYVGEIRLPASGHWLVLIEDEAKTWRMMASVILPAAGEVVIGEVDSVGQLK